MTKLGPNPKPPKLTDAERHARFVETAREVEVDESEGAFDRAFDKVEVTIGAPKGSEGCK
jgi:hypothetical protein